MPTVKNPKRQRAHSSNSDHDVQNALKSFRHNLESGWDLVVLPQRIRKLLRSIHRRLYDADLSSATTHSSFDRFTEKDLERFGEVVGTTIGGYIDDQRIAAGAGALVRTSAGVGQIALALGYHSSQAFSMAFRRRIGCPPSQYRVHGKCKGDDIRFSSRLRRKRHQISL